MHPAKSIQPLRQQEQNICPILSGEANRLLLDWIYGSKQVLASAPVQVFEAVNGGWSSPYFGIATLMKDCLADCSYVSITSFPDFFVGITTLLNESVEYFVELEGFHQFTFVKPNKERQTIGLQFPSNKGGAGVAQIFANKFLSELTHFMKDFNLLRHHDTVYGSHKQLESESSSSKVASPTEKICTTTTNETKRGSFWSSSRSEKSKAEADKSKEEKPAK